MKGKLKIWPVFLMVGMLALFASMNVVDDVKAERTIPPYDMTYTTAKIKPDSTAAKVTGVDSIVGPAVPFFFTNLGDYGDIEGYIYVETCICDSGSSAADTIDLSKDSLMYTMYTSYDYGRTVKHIIEKCSLITYAGGRSLDTIFFTLPPGTGTSGIGDNVFFNFNYAIADSDYSVARAGAGVKYRIRVHMQPKR